MEDGTSGPALRSTFFLFECTWRCVEAVLFVIEQSPFGLVIQVWGDEIHQGVCEAGETKRNLSRRSGEFFGEAEAEIAQQKLSKMRLLRMRTCVFAAGATFQSILFSLDRMSNSRRSSSTPRTFGMPLHMHKGQRRYMEARTGKAYGRKYRRKEESVPTPYTHCGIHPSSSRSLPSTSPARLWFNWVHISATAGSLPSLPSPCSYTNYMYG